MLNHPSEEQLILHYYGEEGAALDGHFAACEACRQEYRRLQLVLNSVEGLPVPERPADYGAEVWARISPRVGGRRRRWWAGWFEWRRMAAVAAMLAVVAGAYIAGRNARPPARPPATAQTQVRERILLVALGNHLERSQMVLAELSNLGPRHKGRVDISYEQQTAEDLVESSRLYRMTAASTGDTASAVLLDELERVLIDVANGPSQVSGEQLANLQQRIADAGILFKVRVFASKVDQRGAGSKVTN